MQAFFEETVERPHCGPPLAAYNGPSARNCWQRWDLSRYDGLLLPIVRLGYPVIFADLFFGSHAQLPQFLFFVDGERALLTDDEQFAESRADFGLVRDVHLRWCRPQRRPFHNNPDTCYRCCERGAVAHAVYPMMQRFQRAMMCPPEPDVVFLTLPRRRASRQVAGLTVTPATSVPQSQRHCKAFDCRQTAIAVRGLAVNGAGARAGPS